MAYETGTATDPDDLLDKLRLFCIAQSITVNEFTDDTTYQFLSIEFGSGFYTIAYDDRTTGSTPQTIIMTQHTAWNTSTAFGSQPNQTDTASNAPQCNFVLGSISEYHFFYFPSGMLYASFQMGAGNWSHFGCGDVTKWGTYTGGSLIMGNYISPSTADLDDPFDSNHAYFGLQSTSSSRAHYLRVDEPISNKFFKLRNSEPQVTKGYSSQNNSAMASNSGFYRSTPSAVTQATSTQPLYFFIEDQVTSGKSRPVGVLPDCRLINLQFFNAGDTFDTDWKVFPIAVKKDETEQDDTINTGFLGMAFRFQ